MLRKGGKLLLATEDNIKRDIVDTLKEVSPKSLSKLESHLVINETTGFL
jgi:hypothetical protein